MSFVMKGLKKAWNFVKDNWKTIALVAAVVFTAGVASVGFAAFAGVTGPMSFMSAVGSTMWAGTTAIAGTMGIGSGAVIPGGATAGAAAGVEGSLAMAAAEAGVTNVGLGAAWGAGAEIGTGLSAGWGAGGQVAAGQALEAASSGAYQGVIAEGGTKAAAKAAAKKAATDFTTQAGGKGLTDAGSLVMKGKEAGSLAGMTTQEAINLGLAAAPVVGTALMAAGQPPEFKNVDYWATTKGGELGPGVNALEVPNADAAIEGAGNPGEEGMGLMNMQQGRSQMSITPGTPDDYSNAV